MQEPVCGHQQETSWRCCLELILGWRKAEASSSQAEHQPRQETLENGLKRQLYGNSKHTAPVLSKPPLPKGMEIQGPQHQNCCCSTQTPSTEISLSIQTTQSTCIKVPPRSAENKSVPSCESQQPTARADLSSGHFGTSGPVLHMPWACSKFLHHLVPYHTRTNSRRNQKSFHFFKLATAVAGNILATSNHILTLNNLLPSVNPLQQQAPPAGRTSAPKPEWGTAAGRGTAAKSLPSRTASAMCWFWLE